MGFFDKVKDFFYEECVDCPEDCVPYIEVNENNPWFFSKDAYEYIFYGFFIIRTESFQFKHLSYTP